MERKGNKKVSVIICTFGQHLYLNRVIDLLKLQTVHFSQLIIVDNNQKPSNFSDLVRGIDSVQIIHLPKPNLSDARNVGIKNSNGEFLLFLDDDAIPHKNWIEEILNGFEKYNSDMIGGRVNLSFQENEPRWFTKACRLYLSELTYYDENIEDIIPPRYLVGTNMAFSKRTFDEYGLFIKDGGRIGKKLVSLEDVEMVRRIYKYGGKISYMNSANVDHVIPKDRTKFTYMIKRSFWQGISDAVLERIHPLNFKKSKKNPKNLTFFLEIIRFLGRLFYKVNLFNNLNN